MDPRLREEVVRLIIALTSDNGISLSKGLESRVSALEKTSQIHSDTILRITQGLDDANKRIIALEQSRDDLVASVSDAQLAISRLESSTGALQTVVNGLDSSVTQLGARVGQLETGLAELRVDHDNLVARVDTAERNIGSLTTELSTLTLRLDGLINSGQNSIGELSTRLSNVETSMVTTAGRGLQKNGNTLNVIVGNGMWFNSSNQLQLDLSGQSKGVGFVGTGMVVKIDTNYFAYNSNGEITLVSQINELPSRVSTLESAKIDSVLPPLTVREASGVRTLSFGYDTSDFTIINSVLSLRSRLTLPTYRYPLELDTANNRVQVADRFGMRTGTWTGQLQYQHPQLSWRANVTLNLMKVDDWLVLSFSQMTTNSIMADGKFLINFVSGLSSGWQTGDTEPSSTIDPLSTTFAAVQFLNNGQRIDAFRIMGVSEWTDGELEIKNYGGTYTGHTQVYWAPWTIMYPCNVR
nr:sigma1 [synthetic construct]